jgi:hypothetical protein
MADQKFNIKIFAMDKTKKGFASAAAGIKRITKAVFSMKSALVLVAGATGFGFLIKRSLDATDSLKKTADKIGTTTSALGGLRYAAEITGVETRTMDMALQRFTRRTAEAAKGTGEAKGAIKELGINAKELNNMPLDKRMLILADAFGKVRNDSDKLRLAFKLFDSEGAALVNTLGLGREGLQELLGEAKMLGLTMSTDAAAGVEKANDSIVKLMSVGKGLTDQFTAALAPAIEEAVTQLTRFFTAISKEQGGVEKWAQSLAKGFLQSIANIITALDTGLEAISGFVNKANSIFNSIEVKSQENKIESFKDKILSLYGEIKGIEAGGLPSLSDILMGENLDDKKDKIESLMNQVILADQKLKEMQQPLVDNGLGDFFDKSIAKILELKEAIGGSDGKPNIFVPTIEGLNNVQQSFKDWQTTVKDSDEIVKAFTTNALNGMTDALTAGITGAANFADAMKSMAKSVVDSLIKMLIQKYIVDAAFGAITGSFGGGGTSVTGGTAASGGIGMGQGFSNTAAIGGPVFQGQSTLVGERGPEIFVPNASGSIIPNNKLGGGSGVTINQTINVTTGIQSTVRAEIVGLMPQIAQAAKGAVADARLRGGNFSKAMSGA